MYNKFMSYYVYVLINPENKIYIGQTNDLERRLSQHNNLEFKGTLHTKRHKGPWKVVYSEIYATRSEAMLRERQLKTSKARRILRERINQNGGC